MTEESSTRYEPAPPPRLIRNNNNALLTTVIKAPLLLPIFSLLPNARDYPLPTALFFAIIDLVNANALVTISDSNQAVSGRLYSALRKQIRWDGVEVAAWYERIHIGLRLMF